MRQEPHEKTPTQKGRYFLGLVDYENKGRRNCEASITWELSENGRFSMQAEIWKPRKDDIYIGGQCVDTVAAYFPNDKLAARMVEVWQRWHLNHMRPGCEHQRAVDTTRKVEVVTYNLTTEASYQRTQAIEFAAKAAANGVTPDLSDTDRALIHLVDWFKDRHQPPDADSPLSGCYEVRKREEKAVGWVTQEEHPDGMLSRPCDVCGYAYGSRWLKEELPPEIVAEIRSWSAAEAATED